MPKQLGIHVIGPRLGESVVLELPDGGVGVIDSYAGHGGRHPVVEFLSRRFSTLKELRFFAVTHPHADHCFRCAEICDAFPPQEAWIFRPFPLGQLRDFYEALQSLGSADSVEKAGGLPSGSVIHSLLKFEKQISTLRKAGKLNYRPLAWKRTFDLCGGDVKIHFLTPGDDQQFAYAEDLKRSLQKISKNGKSLVEVDKLSEPRHNLASGGMLIEFGTSRALLMADAEEELWEEWYAGNPAIVQRKPVHFLKASHHGSKNGYHAKLYSELADPKHTVAVITPFNQGSVHLPNSEGVELLRSHVKVLYCTNRNMATTSTSLNWDPVTPKPKPSLPGSWLTHIATKPNLAKLLVTSPPSTGGRPPGIPSEWVVGATKKPTLWHLIKPGYRLPIPGLVPAEDFAISAFLNDAGKITQLVGGDGTGMLV